MDDKYHHHLILGNLPKNYLIDDVNYLVEEARPLQITELDETKVFKLKFCQISLSSAESLKYLINKLDGFVLRGEKLIAVERNSLLHENHVSSKWKTHA